MEAKRITGRTNRSDNRIFGYSITNGNVYFSQMNGTGYEVDPIIIVANKYVISHAPITTTVTFSVITVSYTHLKTASVYQLFLKRLMDIAGSLVGLVVTGIMYVILAPMIKKQSPGPVFCSQERVGRNGRRFRIYKFRSMYADAEERKKDLMAQNEICLLYTSSKIWFPCWMQTA